MVEILFGRKLVCSEFFLGIRGRFKKYFKVIRVLIGLEKNVCVSKKKQILFCLVKNSVKKHGQKINWVVWCRWTN